MATVFELVRSASAMLRASGVDTPEHDAKLLAAEVFGVDLQTVDKAMLMGSETSELAKQGAKQSGEDAALKRFHTMVDRRSKREPLQHITGHAPFRYLDLKVGPGVFIPRQETELVVQEGVDWITKHGMYSAKVVDLCAGSGAIGLSFVTGSAAFIVGSGAGGNETQTGCDNEWTGGDNADSISKKVQIEGITTGVVVDYGIKDAMNMGAAMAPAACELIVNHLSDFGRKASYYDRIVTGDLGSVGQKILIDLCRQKGVDISKNHEDCGMKMFDATNQNTGSGGSGCACSATVLSAYYLPKLRSGELKRILFVPTGALLSPVSFNEGESVPGIAHGVVLEASI